MSAQQVSRWGFVGMGGLACLLFLDLGTVRVAPWWVTVLFLAVWGGLFWLATRWFVPSPGRIPWLAVGGFVVWLATVVLGASALGWGS